MLIKRSIASIIAGMAGMAPIAGAQAAFLTINAIIHEQVGYQPHLGCFGGTITGSGMSSFLGTVSIAAHDCMTPTGNNLSFDGKMTFTVSTGGEIFADYFGLFVPTRYPSIFTLKDSFFSITGGTGSFLGAKGGGKLFGMEDILSGWGLMQATGEISGFKKSKKGTESSLEFLNLAGPADENAIVAINELPEPGSLALLGIGLASLAFVRPRVSH